MIAAIVAGLKFKLVVKVPKLILLVILDRAETWIRKMIFFVSICYMLSKKSFSYSSCSAFKVCSIISSNNISFFLFWSLHGIKKSLFSFNLYILFLIFDLYTIFLYFLPIIFLKILDVGLKMA